MKNIILIVVTCLLSFACSHSPNLKNNRTPAAKLTDVDLSSVILNYHDRKPLIMSFNAEFKAQEKTRKWYWFASTSKKNTYRQGENADLIYLKAENSEAKDSCVIYGDNDVQGSSQWKVGTGSSYYLSEGLAIKEGFTHAPGAQGFIKYRFVFKNTKNVRWQPEFLTLECSINEENSQVKTVNQLSNFFEQRVTFQ